MKPTKTHWLLSRFAFNRKPVKRFTVFIRLGVSFFVLLVLFFFGPKLIQAGYRTTTPETVIQRQREEYSRLENSESRLNPTARTISEQTRSRLFLWFHARGLSIDEDDEATPLWQPWAELIAYWRS